MPVIKSDHNLRTHLVRQLDWRDAHVSFDDAVDGIPPAYYGQPVEGLPYTLWQLVEHVRLTQFDILDFFRNPDYKEQTWPDDYWPRTPAPPSPTAWDETLKAYRTDRETIKSLTMDPAIDLYATIPHGDGQTYLREILLVADHTAYHAGQIILLRRLLGIWK